MTDAQRLVQSKKLFKKISRKMGTTMRDHSLIVEGDRLLVGLSGGKDSMILLEALVERRAAVPFNFEIEAAHVEATGIGYEIDREKLDEFCKSLNIPLHYRNIEPDLGKDSSKSACFVCSWHRRKVLFELTRDLDCNKLALGHHRHDAIETLLMNMIYHGRFSSMPYSLKMFDGRVHLIRPLMDLEENLLKEYADLNDLVKVEKKCPHQDLAQRRKIALLIKEVETLHGPGPFNIFNSMNNVFPEYLPSDQDSE